VQVGRAAVAAAAAHVLPQLDCEAVVAEALNEIDGVENSLVFTPAADRDERYFRLHELAECSAEAMLARLTVAGTHVR
jgi:hypothetical protein